MRLITEKEIKNIKFNKLYKVMKFELYLSIRIVFYHSWLIHYYPELEGFYLACTSAIQNRNDVFNCIPMECLIEIKRFIST